MATNRQRYMISVDDEVFNMIEDYRFNNRFQTRSEATQEIIRIGLDAISKGRGQEQKQQKDR